MCIQSFTCKLTLAVILVLAVIAHLNAQTNDSTAPEISDFSFTPSNIDTSNNFQTVTVTIRATDAGRGVSQITVLFQSRILGYQGVKFFINSSHRISGNNKDGVYRATAVFPQYIKAGEWQVSEIETFDGVNHQAISVLALAKRGFATQLLVTSNNEDTSGPEISDFSFTPSVIDVTDSSQIVTVTVRARDAKAGVNSVTVGFRQPGNDSFFAVSMDSRHRTSGDNKDGIYKVTRTFSNNVQPGIYDVEVITSDLLLNQKYYQSTELAELGYGSRLQVNRTPVTSVLISGQVLTTNGRGVSGSLVSLTDPNGNIRYTTTNSFGYYRFEQVKLGGTYTLKANHKRFSFSSQVYFIDSARTNLNFSANP